jgi:hypothetical protein
MPRTKSTARIIPAVFTAPVDLFIGSSFYDKTLPWDTLIYKNESSLSMSVKIGRKIRYALLIHANIGPPRPLGDHPAGTTEGPFKIKHLTGFPDRDILIPKMKLALFI